MAKVEYVSVDLGYGFVKAVSSNGKQILFPSIVGSGRERGLANFLEDKKSVDNIDFSELHIKVNGQHYYIGDMALKNSLDGSRVFERERYNHEYSKILMNVAIQLVSSSDTEEVILFTGLPLDYYKSQHKEFREKLLEQQQPIEWVSGMRPGTRSVSVRKADVFPQGISSVWSTLLNHDGKSFNKGLLLEGNQIAVIDIGFRTTDVCVVEMQEGGGFRPLLPFCETIDQGVVNLNENIRLAYQNRTSGQDISENKINRILKTKSIKYKGKSIDLTKEVEESHQAVANSINDRINKLWKDESDTFDHIFAVGGGGSIFMDYLQSNFDNRLTTIVASQFANAIGYYRIGKLLSDDSHPEQIAT